MNSLLYESVEQKGTFTIHANIQDLSYDIQKIPTYWNDDRELDENEEPILNQEEQDVMKDFKKYLAEGFDWKPLFDKIPRKKNGTFAKNRILVLEQGHEFSWEDEDSYGMRGPELRLKVYSDTEAQLEFGWNIIDKW